MTSEINLDTLSGKSRDYYNRRGAEYLCHLARMVKDTQFLLIMQHAEDEVIDPILCSSDINTLTKSEKIAAIREQFYNHHPWRTGDLKRAPYVPIKELMDRYMSQFSAVMENILKSDPQAWLKIASLADKELNKYEDNTEKAMIRSARRNFGEI